VVRLPARRRPHFVHLLLCGLLIAAVAGGVAAAAQSKTDIAVAAYKYGYRISGSSKADIRVHVGDLLRITFSAEDIPHSFTIDDDHYRISRRAEPGKPPTRFEFLADKPGTFEIYCNLSNDPRCRRETIGRLIVEEK
jgi:heme/copper-type cytochrome/quinol oxidase subunit 2